MLNSLLKSMEQHPITYVQKHPTHPWNLTLTTMHVQNRVLNADELDYHPNVNNTSFIHGT